MAESTSRDTPILTVSSRLARHLLFKNSEEQRKIGKQVWETPPIQDLDSWFKDKWKGSWPDRYILSHTQSIKIWESIIENDPECKHTIRNESIQKEWNLLNRRSSAQKAAEAYRFIKEYKLSINTNQTQYVKETNLFAKWAKKYKRAIDDKKAIDIADLIDVVRQGMKDHHIPIPKQIELNGFEEITPQLETWLDFLESRIPRYFLTQIQKAKQHLSSATLLWIKISKSIHWPIERKNLFIAPAGFAPHIKKE